MSVAVSSKIVSLLYHQFVKKTQKTPKREIDQANCIMARQDRGISNYKQVGTALAILFPVGLPLYLVGTRHQSNLKKELKSALHVCDEITNIITQDINDTQETRLQENTTS